MDALDPSSQPAQAVWMNRIILAISALVFYLVTETIYNIYFHPLAKFPGPRLAAASKIWTLWHDNVRYNEPVYEELHRKYNTHALRIGPNELHISDLSLYKHIYRQNTPYMKQPSFYAAFGGEGSSFKDVDPEKHRERRKLLNPLFNRTSVFKFEPVIHEKMDALMRKIDEMVKTQPRISAFGAMRCLTVDIISELAFARSANTIDEQPNAFRCNFLEQFEQIGHSIWFLIHHTWLVKLMHSLPDFVKNRMLGSTNKGMSTLDFAKASLQNYQRHGKTSVTFNALFKAVDHLPDEEQIGEAISFLVAGSDTTALTLVTALAYILNKPEVEKKLREALHKGNADDYRLQELERNEYLGACIKEAMRLGMAIPGRLPRIVPPADKDLLVVDGMTVPPGSIVGMSAYSLHTDPTIWGKNAFDFVPERWLVSQEETFHLDQYYVPYSRGPRMCVGYNIANAELYIVLAYLFRRYKMKIEQSIDEVLSFRNDHFVVSLDGEVEIEFTPV